MPILRVRCVNCGKWIPTGMDVSRGQLIDLTYTERTTECTYCEVLQTWNLDDVDMSVFSAGRPK